MRFLRRFSVFAVVVALATAAGISMVAAAGHGTVVKASFTSSVGLYPGSDVRILGVPVGTVSGIEPDGDHVEVTMELDSGVAAAADTGAVIVAPTMVSDRFVQLTEPHTDGPKLAAGDTIERTAVPAEIDDLYRSMSDLTGQLGPEGLNQNGALSRFLTVAAGNLDGNGEGINTLITEFGRASGTMANSGEDLFGTVDNLARISTTLERHDSSVVKVNDRLQVVADYLSDDRRELTLAMRNLSGAMADLDEFIAENRDRLKTSVEKLQGPARVLVNQQAGLEEMLRNAPLALEGFLGAYNPQHNTLDGRGNLNELTVWQKKARGAQSGPDSTEDAPPLLLPDLGSDVEGAAR